MSDMALTQLLRRLNAKNNTTDRLLLLMALGLVLEIGVVKMGMLEI